MTLWELNDLMIYWKDHPPTHVLVAAYLMGGNKAHPIKRRHGGNHGGARREAKTELSDLVHTVALAGGAMHQKLPEVYRQCRN